MANRFIQYFENSIKDNWDLPAMTDYETRQTLNYSDVAKEITKLHVLFKSLNIREGDKIALLGDNSSKWSVVFLATLTYGAVIVPILQSYNPLDQENVLSHSEAKLLFVDLPYSERLGFDNVNCLRAVFSLLDYHCIYTSSVEVIDMIKNVPLSFKQKYSGEFRKQDVEFTSKDDKELVILNYTSGTTGDSKAVMLSGENFFCLFEFGRKYKIGSKKKIFLSYIPLAHIFGYGDGIFFPIISGSHVVYIPKLPHSSNFIPMMQEIKPNYVSMVPMVLNSICQKEIIPYLESMEKEKTERELKAKLVNIFGGALDRMVVGGASMDCEVEKALARIGFPYLIAYGMTECASLLSQESKNRGNGSVGEVIDGVEIMIDSDDPYSMPGEVLVKGSNVMMGYYRNAEATASAFKNGWYKTGDLGIIDEEGCLYIKGRCKLMILTSSGQNIYPEDIELKINSLRYISESIVIQKDNKLIALVYPNIEVIKGDRNAEDLQEIMEEQRKEINTKLATYEYIDRFVVFNSAFEKTAKNSIKRHLYEKID